MKKSPTHYISFLSVLFKTRKYYLGTISFLLMIVASAEGQTSRLSAKGIKELNDFLGAATTSKKVPGIVAMVANKNAVIYQNAFGLNSIMKKDSMKLSNIFAIASMTKAVTCVAVMQLIEQHKLELDDAASRYFPEIGNLQVVAQLNETDTTWTTKPASHPITIKELLTHTSGLGYAFCNKILAKISAKKYPGQILAPYTGLPLVSEPGTKWIYGTGMDVLGKIIENISGVTLDKYFYENIFKPLGMENTFFQIPENKHQLATNFFLHQNNLFLEQPGMGKQKPAELSGGGGLYSTAEDYTKFLQLFLNHGTPGGAKILSKKSVEEMSKNQIGDLVVEAQEITMPALANPVAPRPSEEKFGYGFLLTSNRANEAFTKKPGSISWSGLFNTYFWVDPSSGIAAVILMQVLPFNDKNCSEILNKFENVIYQNIETK